MAHMQRVSLLRAQLIRRNIRVTNEWLEGCVEYFIGERPGITDQELLEETFEQYLLADVCDIGLPCIPERIVRVKEMQVIEERFTAQMQCLMNVAESPYDLLQQMYKKQLDETDEEKQNRKNNKATHKKQRMLRLELTDGKVTCSGMEYSPIPQLNVNLRPGTKLRIIGPVKCINHVLFLESKNVEILGGEVDTLLVINAFENMLLKALNKPINENPKAEYPGIVSSQTQNGTGETAPAMANTSINGMRSIESYMTPTRTPATREMRNDDPFEDSDIFAQVDLTALTAAKPAKPQPVSNYNDFEDDADDLDALAQIEEQILAQQARKRPSTSPIPGPSNSFMYCEPPEVTQVSKVPKLEGLDDLDDDFDLMVAAALDLPIVPKPVSPVKYHTSDYKFRLEGCNLLTFNQLNKISDEDKANQVFMCFADAKQVTKPLAIVGDRWTLELNLEDVPENTLSVTLIPELLDKLIGFNAHEVKLMRQQAKTQPSLKEEIFNVLKNFNDALKNERKFWKIKFGENSGENLKPTVISVSNLKTVYKRILLNKIDAEKLEELRATVPD